MKRRNVVRSIGLIGASAAVGGASTWALMNDSEYQSTTFTAGEMDLKMGWTSYLNGEQNTHSPPDDRDGTFGVSLDSLTPCDSGVINFGIQNTGNAAHIFVALEITEDSKQVTEQVTDSDGNTKEEVTYTDGNLDTIMEFSFFRDDNHDGQSNNTGLDLGPDSIRSILNRYSLSRDQDGVSLGVIEDPVGYTIEWEIPCSAGDEIENNNLELSIFVYTVQARNNETPEAEWPTPTPTSTPTPIVTQTDEQQTSTDESK